MSERHDKANRLLSAMEGIRDEYICEAAAPAESAGAGRPPKRNRWIRWSALAACLCAAALGGAALYRSASSPRWPVKEIPASQSSGENAAPLPRWEERGISEQYSSLPYGGEEYGGTAARLEEGQTDGLLGSAVLSGQDYYTDEIHTAQGGVYRIRGIAAACAVAVRFEGDEEGEMEGTEDGGYYVYRNSAYRPETLGQLIHDLNLRETLSFGPAWYNAEKADGSWAQIAFPDLPDEEVWERLLSDPALPNVWSDQTPFINAMSISVNIPLLGYENISLGVTADGYLTTNILDTGKAFCIGEEAARSFIDYVLENFQGYEIVYTEPEGSTVPEGASGETAAAASVSAQRDPA